LGARTFAASTDHSFCRSLGCEALAAFEEFIGLAGLLKNLYEVRDDKLFDHLTNTGFGRQSPAFEVPECISCRTNNVIVGKPEPCTYVEVLQVAPTCKVLGVSLDREKEQMKITPPLQVSISAGSGAN
jgi:hypothetical protein